MHNSCEAHWNFNVLTITFEIILTPSADHLAVDSLRQGLSDFERFWRHTDATFDVSYTCDFELDVKRRVFALLLF